MYVREDVSIKPLSVTNIFNQYCKFEIIDKRADNPLTVTLVYRSPNSTRENNLELAKILENCEDNALFIGDFNLPSFDTPTVLCPAKCRPILDAAQSAFLVNVVNFPTHVRGGILDLALTNNQEAINSVSDLGNLGNSDHCAIHIVVNLEMKTKDSCQRICDWRRGDTEGLINHFSEINFDDMFEDKNVGECWDDLKSSIYTALDRYIPLRFRRKSGQPPWLTHKVKNLLNKKRRHWRKFRDSRSDAHLTQFKETEKACKKAVQLAKRQFERKIANSANKRPFNAYVKAKSKCRSNVGPLKVNGISISDDDHMASVLNDYFVSVFNNDDDARTAVPNTYNYANVLSNLVISSDTVKKKINNLKISSAPGPDQITPRFLKLNVDAMSHALAILFNKSLQTGLIPADWKSANVTPIFKKGSKADPGNYRPVSLTSIPCKLQESCIRDAVMDHLVDQALIKSSQHGFMKHRSCTTNLLEFLERMTREVDNKMNMDVVYLDFAKAFDKVPHKRLVDKLKAHGITGNILWWIINWLSDRRQRTVLNGQASDWGAVGSGVPQGSVLGPLCFVVFINDLDDSVEHLVSIVNKFADDTKVGKVITTQADADNLQLALDNLVEWASRWGMEFNVKKCKVMHVGNSNPRASYTMTGASLDTTAMEKDIGVKVQDNLRPSLHCAEAAQRANAVLGQITRAFHYRDRNTYIQLYKQYVRPHLEFAVPAWSPWTLGDIHVLEKVQMRAIKMVSGLSGRTYEDRLRELGMLTLAKRRVQLDLTQTFKILKGLDAVDPAIWFVLVGPQPGRLTRATSHPLNIVRGNFNTDIRKNFFSNRVIDTWNSLPDYLKDSVTVNSFKNGLKVWLSNPSV